MRSGRTVALLAPAAGLAASLLVLHPGQYSFDSAYQLWQARSGAFNDTSPVAMTALWSLLLTLVANPASLLWVNLALFWAGLGLCVATVARSPWMRLVLLSLLGFAPLTLVEMGQLLSDAHLAALLTFATGLAAWGLARRQRTPLFVACAVLVYAGCVRHNAPIAILPFGAIAAQALLPARAEARERQIPGDTGTNDARALRAIGWRTACGAALALALTSVVLGAALDRMLAREHATVWPSLALWDLAAISVAHETMLLPPFTHGPGLTADELVATGAFDPTSNTLLYQKSHSGVRDGLGESYSAPQLRALRRAWVAAALRYPGAYLRHRLRTLWLLIGPHRGAIQGTAYFEARTSYRDNPPLPAPFAPNAQRRLYALAASLVPTWCFAALPYLIASLLAITVAARHEVPGRVAIAVAVSAIVYTLPLALLAPAAELR
ncbi:MAG: hypothetical protein ACREX6_03970, partial [Casimicrobiaceae bacterium]